MTKSTLRCMSFASLHASYCAGQLTPRQLVAQIIEQANRQQDFNTWIYRLSDAELEPYLQKLDGCSADDLPLYGIPFAIKDNIDLAGVPTTAACPAFAYTPSESAPVVAALIEAGAIPIGKTNLDQFATGLVGTRSPYGEVKNSFNPDYICGGSSAGSASATALGQVSFALGTDTAGSGRVPAVLNNIVGHKPTKGLISTQGVVPACRSLDCVSLFALHSEDIAVLAGIVFGAENKTETHDAYTRINHHANRLRYFNPGQGDQTFSFGVPAELDFQGNTETERLFKQARDKLVSRGGIAVELDFSDFLEAARLLYQGPWVSERWLATQGVDHNVILPVIAEIIAGANTQTAADAFAAQYQLAELKMRCDKAIAGLDFVLTPTTPTIFTRAQIAEQPIAYNSILGTYTNFMNLLDYCATAVPVGFTSSDVPWGVTLFAPAMHDIKLLGFADLLHRGMNMSLACSGHAIPESRPAAPLAEPTLPEQSIEVVVCGAHLQGQPLNWQLTERGATLIEKTSSAACYQLFALADGKRPAMIRNTNDGTAIEVEVWSLPNETFGSFVAGIPAPLGIGKVELHDGRWLSGFVCEDYGLQGAKNITHLGGWRKWLVERER